MKMKTYEITYLISSEIPEQEAKKIQEKINSLIQKQGGILKNGGLFLRNKLAYPIKKQTQAFLIVLKFQINPENLLFLEKEIKAEKQVLRYLILAQKPLKERTKEMFPKPLAERRDKSLLYPSPRSGELKKPVLTPALAEDKKVKLKEIEKKLEGILEEI